jgi:hypothetical protein
MEKLYTSLFSVNNNTEGALVATVKGTLSLQKEQPENKTK